MFINPWLVGRRNGAPHHAGADSGSDRVITVTFDAATAGKITLKGTSSGSDNFANLNVIAIAVHTGGCAPQLGSFVTPTARAR